jgi:hypothetical protein
MDNPVNYNKLKRLKVYDVYGKFVLEKIFSGPQYKLASENLNKGIYFYKIFMDDKLLQGGKLVVH